MGRQFSQFVIGAAPPSTDTIPKYLPRSLAVCERVDTDPQSNLSMVSFWLRPLSGVPVR